MFLNESIIVALAFFIFVPLVYKPVKSLLFSFIDNYAQEAIKNLTESKKMRDESEKLLLQMKRDRIEAQKTTNDIIKNSEEEVAEILENMKAEIKEMTKKKVDLSISRISQQEKQIIENLKNEAIQKAVEQVEFHLVNELDKSAQLSLIDSNISNIKKLVH